MRLCATAVSKADSLHYRAAGPCTSNPSTSTPISYCCFSDSVPVNAARLTRADVVDTHAVVLNNALSLVTAGL